MKPTCSTVSAIASSTGRARATSAASPPICTARRRLRAPDTPPLTGASSMAAPTAFNSVCIRRTRSGELVVKSISSELAPIAARNPSVLANTASISFGPGRLNSRTRIHSIALCGHPSGVRLSRLDKTHDASASRLCQKGIIRWSICLATLAAYRVAWMCCSTAAHDQ